MTTLHPRDWEPGKALNGFVYRCSHLVFGLLLCFVSAAGLQGRVTGDGAYRCGLRKKKRTLRNINNSLQEKDEKYGDDDSRVYTFNIS